jgi:hypothetical protein
MLYWVHIAISEIRTENISWKYNIEKKLNSDIYNDIYKPIFVNHKVVIGTDSSGSCKSNYYMITNTTAPYILDQ